MKKTPKQEGHPMAIVENLAGGNTNTQLGWCRTET